MRARIKNSRTDELEALCPKKNKFFNELKG